ncbi:MAG: amidohydrolase family protein [Candidatus Binatia bacterium]
MTRLGYDLYDADTHYYEPDDCFTRHIEARFRDRTVWIDRGPDGTTHPGHVRRARALPVLQRRRRRQHRRARHHEGLPARRDGGGRQPSLQPINGLAVPEFTQRPARLRVMDEQGVTAALLLPTAGVGVEPQLRETPEVLYPSLRAFNRWLEEDWGYGADGRIYGAPLLSLFDRDAGLAELERLLARGARFAVLTAGPFAGRSPADPYFDPFWARCEEAELNVVYHIGRTPFSEMYNPPWGLRPHPPSHRHTLMEWALSFTERPVVDTLTALIADNLFGRFPRLRILSIEYGSGWVAPLLHKLDHLARLFSKDMWRFGTPPLKPSETFRQNVWVSPFFEDDIPALAALIGPAHVLGGSDYPHPEGLLRPVELADELPGMSAEAVRLVMRDNLAGLL